MSMIIHESEWTVFLFIVINNVYHGRGNVQSKYFNNISFSLLI